MHFVTSLLSVAHHRCRGNERSACNNRAAPQAPTVLAEHIRSLLETSPLHLHDPKPNPRKNPRPHTRLPRLIGSGVSTLRPILIVADSSDNMKCHFGKRGRRSGHRDHWQLEREDEWKGTGSCCYWVPKLPGRQGDRMALRTPYLSNDNNNWFLLYQEQRVAVALAREQDHIRLA